MKKWIILSGSLIVLLLSIGRSEMSPPQKDKKFEQSRRAAFRLILSEEQRKMIDALPDDSSKSQWAARYWKSLDPTPTTPENERYEEHLRRFTFARSYYSNIIPPLYFDDRGRYYIKYGEPSDFSESIGIGESYLSNLTWAYHDLNLFIDFVEKETYGYQEVNDLSEAVRSAPQNMKAYIAAELYSERENLHYRYTGFRDVKSSHDVSSVNRFFVEASALLQEKTVSLEQAPAQKYHHDYQADPLSASLQCANFRGDGKETRMEFYYSVSLEEITFVPGQTYPLESHLEKRISILDRDMVEVVNKPDHLRLIANSLNQVRGKLYVNQHDETLEPGMYHVALRLENPQGKRLAILKTQISVKDFTGNRLLLSDLELASQIRENGSGRGLKSNNIQVVPYLPRSIRRESPLYVYFEIYNLEKNSEGFTEYEVNYTLQTKTGTGNILTNSVAKIAPFLVGGRKTQSVATSFNGSGTSEFQQIYLLLNFSNSPSGKTDFLVTVADLVTGQQATTKSGFTLK